MKLMFTSVKQESVTQNSLNAVLELMAVMSKLALHASLSTQLYILVCSKRPEA